MTTQKETTSWSNAAKSIRKDLKHAFPTIQFSVKSRVYSGGSSVDIEWVEGPTNESVCQVVGKYQYGHFDSQSDYYEMSNVKDIPQVKYVQTQRNIKRETKQIVFEWLQKTHVHFDCVSSIDESSDILLNHWNVWTAMEYTHRILCKKDLTNGLTLGEE